MDLPFKFIHVFGFPRGFCLYWRFKLHLNRRFRLPGLRHPVFLRPGTIDEYTFREIFLMKDYDLEYEPDGSEHPVIIDAGANIGLSSVYFAVRFPDAIIESFEPEEENFALLKKNTEKYPNIRPHKSALWWKSGFLSVVDKGYGLRGYVTVETGNGDLTPALSPEDLMKQNNYSGFYIVKMDIEGAEKELFDHQAEKWLPQVKYLIIELHDRMRPGTSMSFFRALEPYSYSISISGENLVICFHHPSGK